MKLIVLLKLVSEEKHKLDLLQSQGVEAFMVKKFHASVQEAEPWKIT